MIGRCWGESACRFFLCCGDGWADGVRYARLEELEVREEAPKAGGGSRGAGPGTLSISIRRATGREVVCIFSFPSVLTN